MPPLFLMTAGNAGDQTASRYIDRATALGDLIQTQIADLTGNNDANPQPWFAAGSVAVEAKSYLLEAFLYLTHGATTHTTALRFAAGSATIAFILYEARIFSANVGAIATALSSIIVNTANSTVINATAATTATWLKIEGEVRFSAPGFFRPQFAFSADPTGTVLIKRGTYCKLVPKGGDENYARDGTWQ